MVYVIGYSLMIQPCRKISQRLDFLSCMYRQVKNKGLYQIISHPGIMSYIYIGADAQLCNSHHMIV